MIEVNMTTGIQVMIPEATMTVIAVDAMTKSERRRQDTIDSLYRDLGGLGVLLSLPIQLLQPSGDEMARRWKHDEIREL